MEIIILLLLILLNGFFALSEIALVSCRESRLTKHLHNGSRGARFALALRKDSDRFLSAIQVGITLISIITGVYGGLNLADDLLPLFKRISFIEPYAYEIALFLTIFLITYVSIVIGELVPKTIALSKPDEIAVRVAPVIYYFSAVFFPFVKVLSLSTTFVTRLLGVRKKTDSLTETELRHMIKIASKEGVIKEEQNIIHEKVFYFSDKKAKHIMTNRRDLEWIDLDKDPEDIEAQLLQFKHSKTICSRGNLDNFKGILHLKDYYKQRTLDKSIGITDLLVQPLIVLENAEAPKVLEQMRVKNYHFCCVVNEHGSMEGVITLHDIMENLVGEIPDEGEILEPDVFIRDDQSVLVNGDAPVEILTTLIEGFTVDFEQADYSTVAGFVIHEINRIPSVGDHFNYLGHRIEIVDLDGRRIDKILISKERQEL